MTETKTTSLEAAVLDKLRARAAERGVSLLSIPLAVLRHKIMPLIETEDQKAAFAMNRLWLGDAKNFKPQSLKLEGETLIDWLSKVSQNRGDRKSGPRAYISSVAETVTDLAIMINTPDMATQFSPDWDGDVDEVPVEETLLLRWRYEVLLSYFPNLATLTIEMKQGRPPWSHEWTMFTNLAMYAFVKHPKLKHLTLRPYGGLNVKANQRMLPSVLRVPAVENRLRNLQTLVIHGPCFDSDDRKAGEILCGVLPRTLTRLRVESIQVTEKILELLATRCPALEDLALSNSSEARPGAWAKYIGARTIWQTVQLQVSMNEADIDCIGGQALRILEIHWHDEAGTETKGAFMRLLYRSPNLERLNVVLDRVDATNAVILRDVVVRVAKESCPQLKHVEMVSRVVTV